MKKEKIESQNAQLKPQKMGLRRGEEEGKKKEEESERKTLWSRRFDLNALIKTIPSEELFKSLLCCP